MSEAGWHFLSSHLPLANPSPPAGSPSLGVSSRNLQDPTKTTRWRCWLPSWTALGSPQVTLGGFLGWGRAPGKLDSWRERNKGIHH